MKLLLNVFHDHDLYELSVDGILLKKIVRWSSDGQQRTEVSWDSLDEELKGKIVQEFKDRTQT